MPAVERQSTLPFSRDTVVAWHKCGRALQRMMPTWRRVQVERDPSPLIEGARIGMRIEHFGFWLNWAFDVKDRPGRDLRGSEGRFVGSSCVLSDRLEYGNPMGPLGDALIGRGMKAELNAMFQARQLRLAQDLRRHELDGPGRTLRIGVSGSSGLIGQAVMSFLETGGHDIIRIVRGQTKLHDTDVHWDPGRGMIDSDRLEGLDAIIHLAGAGIADRRWDKKRKRTLRSSRVGGTLLLASALADLKAPPRVLVSASATGYYGHQTEPVDEDNGPGEGFLSDLCQEWEAATRAATEAGIRVVVPRIGVVLAAKGGALGSLRGPAKWGLLGPMGSGEQGMSCIGLDDLVYVLHRMIVDDSMEGPYNAVCPEFMTQRAFARTLGRVVGRPSRMPAPATVIKMALGEMGQRLLLDGVFVKPKRLLNAGHAFSQPSVEETLRLQLGRFRAEAVSGRSRDRVETADSKRGQKVDQ